MPSYNINNKLNMMIDKQNVLCYYETAITGLKGELFSCLVVIYNINMTSEFQ